MNLFAYGTLLVPEIWAAVTGRPECPGEEAMLPGYVIRRVKGADYPGVRLGEAADTVAGRVFSALDGETIRRLDEYESSFYDRIPVSLRTVRGETIQSQVYVIPERNRDALSEEGWTLEWFREHAMARYMARHFS